MEKPLFDALLATAFLLILSSVSASPVEKVSLPVFRQVTAPGLEFVHVNGPADQKNYIPEAKGGGVAFLDYNNDGWLDVYLVQGSTIEKLRQGANPHGSLFKSNRDGSFSDVTAEAGLTQTAWGMGVSAGDYDNDGYVDIYLTNLGPNVLYRNNGDGTFHDVTETAGTGDRRWSTSAAFGDYDRDGDLDLYVANYLTLDWNNLPEPKCSHRGNAVLCGPSGLVGASDVLYRNNGDGTFSDVTQESGAIDRSNYYGLGCAWADLDNDGNLDIVVANDATPNLAFRNCGDGRFEEVGFASGLAVSVDGLEQAGMGIDIADYDNDGRPDVFVTHFALEYSTLYHNNGNLMFEDVSARARIVTPEWLLVGWGVRFVDFDHDGWKDIIHSNGHVYPYLTNASLNETYAQPKSFYLNNRDGTFSDVASLVGAGQSPEVSRGVAFGDYDNDGDIDFIAANMNGPPSLYRCELSNGNHWLMFKLLGRKSNRDGIGVRIEVKTGDLVQFWETKRTSGIYSANDPRAHFGLGKSDRAERVVVRWPAGTVQVFEALEADRHYIVDETEGLKQEFQIQSSTR